MRPFSSSPETDAIVSLFLESQRADASATIGYKEIALAAKWAYSPHGEKPPASDLAAVVAWHEKKDLWENTHSLIHQHMTSVKTILERDHRIVIDAVSGEGYRILLENEKIPHVRAKRFEHIEKTARRARKTLLSIDTLKLSPTEQVERTTLLALSGATELLSSRKAIKKLALEIDGTSHTFDLAAQALLENMTKKD